MEGALRVRWLKRVTGKQQAEGKRVKNKCLSGTRATIIEEAQSQGCSLDNLYIPKTSLTICFFSVHDDSSPLFRREAMRLLSAFCLHDPW